MIISERLSDRQFALKVSGKLEFGTRAEFNKKITQVLEQSSSQIILDFHGVTFIDSAALALLIKTSEHCQEHNVSLVIANAPKAIRSIMELVNLSAIIPIFDSIEDVHVAPVLR